MANKTKLSNKIKLIIWKATLSYAPSRANGKTRLLQSMIDELKEDNKYG